LALAERANGEPTVLPLYGLLTVMLAIAGIAMAAERREASGTILRSFI
jgi:carbohydrate-binding DOMON domain-containing protein